MLSFTAFL